MNTLKSIRSLSPALFVLLCTAASRAQAPAPAPAPPAPAPPAPAPPAPVPATPAVEPALPALAPQEPAPLAGWHGGLFYLRDPNDDFRLYFQGRAQVDAYSYFGPGVPDTKLKATLFLRRVRPELSGEFLGHWQWMLAGDFVGATAPIDNAGGAAGSDAQTVGIRAQPTDVFLNYRVERVFNVQVGQFDAPFTMENRTSDKYIPFMERALAARTLGIPSNKEIGAMLWGETSDRLLFYSVGVFNGDGQNRPNLDNQAEVIGRLFTHPMQAGPLKDAQIGASFLYGGRSTYYIYYNYPNMGTQGNFTFWRSTYGSMPSTRIIPNGVQSAFAGEVRVPFDQFDLTGEFVYVKNGTREAFDGLQSKFTERKGDLHGYAYYAQIGWWPLGNRDINGQPGYENPSHVDLAKKDPATPARALQLLVKWEQLHATYASASRTGSVNPMANIDGDIKLNALSLGANYWASKHVRLSLNYVLDMFPGSEPAKATAMGRPAQTSAQRAVAPGNTLDAGVNDDARDNAHVLHEVLARLAVAF